MIGFFFLSFAVQCIALFSGVCWADFSFSDVTFLVLVFLFIFYSTVS
jgi:hypothetical protein